MVEATGSTSIKQSTYGKWSIVLRDPEHKYTITDTTTGDEFEHGGKLLSVSGLIETLFPVFDPKEAVGRMSNASKKTRYPGLSDEEIIAAWRENGKRASDLGTRMHTILEGLVLNPTGVATAKSGFMHENEIVITAAHYNEIRTRIIDMGLYAVRTEGSIFDDVLRLTGTYDTLAYNIRTGKYVLIDWKRRSPDKNTAIYDYGIPGTPTEKLPKCDTTHDILQLNLYRWYIQRNLHIVISEMFIGIAHPLLTSTAFVSVPIDDRIVEDILTFRLKSLSLPNPPSK